MLTRLWNLKQIIAAGPFTTIDNLFFEPLAELLAYARRKQPQLLLLVSTPHYSYQEESPLYSAFIKEWYLT